MRRTRVAGAAVAAVVAAAVAGCVKLEREAPDRHFFGLEVRREEGRERLKPVAGTVLKVLRFKVARPYEGRELVYRQDERTFESDYYNAFLTLPAAQITEAATAWVRDSGGFEHVVDPSSRAAATHYLEGKIEELYGDYRVQGSPKAVVAAQVWLLQESGAGEPRIVLNKRYAVEEPLKEMTPGALVEGYNRALAAVLRNLEGDLGK
jgi:cholesterol transport system auxiliary component